MLHHRGGVTMIIKPDYSRADVSPEMAEIMCLFYNRTIPLSRAARMANKSLYEMAIFLHGRGPGIHGTERDRHAALPSLSEGQAAAQSVHPSNKPRTVSASLAIPASDRSSACTVWRLSQWLKLRPSERLYCGS